MSVAEVRPSLRLVFNSHAKSLYLDRENRTVARRAGWQADSSGYVFTNRPFSSGESLTVRVNAISPESKGVLGYGMTSCDPDSLNVQALPVDCELLCDRPEYWVIDKARFADLSPGDEFDFHFVETADGGGEIKFCKNDQKPASLMFVDKTVALWVFFELGNVREMKILVSSSSYQDPVTTDNYDFTNLTPRSLTFENNCLRPRSNNSSPILPQSPKRSNPFLQTAQVLPTPAQQTRRTEVAIPPRPNPPPIPPRPMSKQPPVVPSSQFAPTPIVLANKGHVSQLAEKLNHLKKAAVGRTVGHQTKRVAPPPPVVSQKSGSRDAQRTMSSSDNECAVCMEKDIDCVLYTCGHMCLCYACAVELKNRTNSECPICRKEITDVIRTFKS